MSIAGVPEGTRAALEELPTNTLRANDHGYGDECDKVPREALGLELSSLTDLRQPRYERHAGRARFCKAPAMGVVVCRATGLPRASTRLDGGNAQEHRFRDAANLSPSNSSLARWRR